MVGVSTANRTSNWAHQISVERGTKQPFSFRATCSRPRRKRESRGGAPPSALTVCRHFCERNIFRVKPINDCKNCVSQRVEAIVELLQYKHRDGRENEVILHPWMGFTKVYEKVHLTSIYRKRFFLFGKKLKHSNANLSMRTRAERCCCWDCAKHKLNITMLPSADLQIVEWNCIQPFWSPLHSPPPWLNTASTSSVSSISLLGHLSHSCVLLLKRRILKSFS